MAAHEVFIIGMGEVGRRLAAALERAQWTVRPVTRETGWDAALDSGNAALRIVAVREEALAAVLDRFTKTLRDRLVLVQNGFLEAVHGDLGPVGRGLIYFTSKGDFFKVLCPTPFHGAHVAPLVHDLTSNEIPAELVPDRDSFVKAMIVKGIWNAVVGLPLAVHGVDLETYLAAHRDEFHALADESARAAGAEYGVSVEGREAVSKIVETTGDLGRVRGGKKALPWRNGAIARFGRRHGIATPVNDRLLRAAGFDPGR